MNKLSSFNGIKTTKEIAELCNVTPSTVCRWAKSDARLDFCGQVGTGVFMSKPNFDESADMQWEVKTNTYRFVADPSTVSDTMSADEALKIMDAMIADNEENEKAAIREMSDAEFLAFAFGIQ